MFKFLLMVFHPPMTNPINFFVYINYLQTNLIIYSCSNKNNCSNYQGNSLPLKYIFHYKLTKLYDDIIECGFLLLFLIIILLYYYICIITL